MDLFKILKNIGKLVPFRSYLEQYYRPYLYKLKFKRKNEAFQKGAYRVLASAQNALNEIGIEFWLEFGTLLGPIRDGKLIKHDIDLDIGLMLDDHSPQIEQVLKNHGFKLVHRIWIEGKYGLEESFELNDINLDLFYFKKVDNDLICHLFPLDKSGANRYIRELKTSYTGFKKFSLNGNNFNIPADPIKRLIDTYGEQYAIPDPNWYTPEDALNSKVIDKKIHIEYK